MKTIIVAISLLLLSSAALALEPVVKSGTRLQARIDSASYAGVDGASIKVRGRYYIYDTSIAHKCEVWTDALGTRCEPTDDMLEFKISTAEYTVVYSDSACSRAYVQITSLSADKVKYFKYHDPRALITDPYLSYRVGALTRLSKFYMLLSGHCATAPGSIDAYDLSTPAPGPNLSTSTATEVLP